MMLQLGGHTQLQKATKNPNQANVNTRPYILNGLSPGTERALWLTGLTTGAFHSVVISYMIADSRKTFRTLDVKGEVQKVSSCGKMAMRGEDKVFVVEKEEKDGGPDVTRLDEKMCFLRDFHLSSCRK